MVHLKLELHGVFMTNQTHNHEFISFLVKCDQDEKLTPHAIRRTIQI